MELLVIFLIVSLIYMVSTFFIHETSTNEVSSNYPFECGFESIFSSRVPFSIHFFSIIIVFLVFDLEVVILFPLISIPCEELNLILVFSFSILILLLGLLIEWNDGTLEWNV